MKITIEIIDKYKKTYELQEPVDSDTIDINAIMAQMEKELKFLRRERTFTISSQTDFKVTV